MPSPSVAHVPMRAITRGPRKHWFGYYDKRQIDPTGRWVLGMSVDFEGRSPRADDVIEIGMVDLRDGDRWIRLGESRAWSWQQGCMLQWLPGSGSTVAWNDRDGGRFVCRVLDIATGAARTLPMPIYALSPDGRWAVTPDFQRLNDTRPGYGYVGIADPFAHLDAPAETGIWRMDLASGDSRLVIPFAAAAAIPSPRVPMTGKHWYNHLLINQDGTRFVFLHRWRGPRNPHGFSTRMFTAAADGSDLRVVDDYGGISHFVWRDPRRIISWAYHRPEGDAFFLYDVDSGAVETVGAETMPVDGHVTYLAGDEWILNDCYPDRERLQHLYLYHLASKRRIPLADLHAPPGYDGEWRCDLHPRSSDDGKTVIIDSAHDGDRQMYLLDISRATRV